MTGMAVPLVGLQMRAHPTGSLRILVKSISVPPLVTPQVKGNLSDLPVRNGVGQPENVGFGKPSAGGWAEVTNEEFLADVRALAKGLMASGIGLGERVAIMSKTRYEWAVTDFAIWTAGAVPVPIYETSSSEQVHWILKDAGCAAVILETPTHAKVLAEARPDLPELRNVWQIDAGGLDTLVAAGHEVTYEEVKARRSQVSLLSVTDFADEVVVEDDDRIQRVRRPGGCLIGVVTLGAG